MIRAAALAVLAAASASAQPTAVPDSLAARTAVWVDGERRDLGAVVDAALAADVVFVGERHDDATAHALQRWLLEAVHRRAGRGVALGLEMFEFDVQPVLDEYARALISERDFLAAARPWANYADYRPLVEYAREHGLRVVGTNAPARHVRSVAREGSLEALGQFPAASLAGYPPENAFADPSPAYAAAFAEAMSGMGGHDADGMLAAQNLRDLAMADGVVRAASGGALVVHLNGSFHSAGGLGIPEHLARRAPGLRALVVTVEPSGRLDAAPDAAPGEIVVLTQGAPAE